MFKPQTNAFSEIWLDGEKAATVEYWRGDISQWDIEKLRNHDTGHGIILKNKVSSDPRADRISKMCIAEFGVHTYIFLKLRI